ITEVKSGEDVFDYVKRISGRFDPALYRQIIGAANEYKEGDASLSIAAADDASRKNARLLLGETKIGDLVVHPVFADAVYDLVLETTDKVALSRIRDVRLEGLKDLLLKGSEVDIRAVMPGLSSDIIAMVVKLMTNDELIRVGQTIFNPLPGTNLGAKGY